MSVVRGVIQNGVAYPGGFGEAKAYSAQQVEVQKHSRKYRRLVAKDLKKRGYTAAQSAEMIRTLKEGDLVTPD